MTFTTTKLANRTARLFRLDDAAKTRAHRSFRNMLTRNILPAVRDEDDERGTLVFDEAVGATALILLCAADMAIDARGLRNIADDLLKLDSVRNERPIDRLLNAARTKREDVAVVTKLTLQDGKLTRVTFLDDPNDKPDGDAAEIIRASKAFNTDLVELRIEAGRFLVPFVAETGTAN